MPVVSDPTGYDSYFMDRDVGGTEMGCDLPEDTQLVRGIARN